MQPREPLLTSPSPASESLDLLEHLNNGAVFYTGKQHGKHLDLLLHLSRYSNLLLTVTGAEGSGKTHIKNRLLQQVDSGVVVTQLDAHKIASAGQLLPFLSDKLNIEAPPKADTNYYLDEIRVYSNQLTNEGGSCLIVIDNAENLQQDALNIILDLAVSTPDTYRPHLVLFGSSQLFDKLNQPENLSRFESAGHHLPLQAFDTQEAINYLQHRCASVGINALPLTQQQLERVLSLGKGLPGQLNLALISVLKQAAGSTTMPSLTPQQPEPKTPKKKQAAPAKTKKTSPQPAKQTKPTSWLPLAAAGIFLAILGAGFLYKDELVQALTSESELAKDLTKDLEMWQPPVIAPKQETEAEAQRKLAQEQAELDQLVNQLDSTKVTPEPEEVTPLVKVEPPVVAPPSLDLPDDTPTASTKVPVVKAEPAPQPKPTPKAEPKPQPAKPPVATNTPKATSTPKAPQWVDKGAKREATLMQKPSSHYTLQMMGSLEEASVLSFIREQGAEAAKFSYFESRYQGKPWYVVVYGDYANRDAAVAASKNLPASLVQLRPWAKSFASVQQDIKQR